MSQGGGDHDIFPWDEKTWVFLDSDNSGGIDGRPGEKPAGESGSNSLTEVVTLSAQKRPRNGLKKGKNVTLENEKTGAAGEPDHEIHIWTERERRKKMRNMFGSLHALLPQLPAKADKSTIVDEAIKTIKTLEATLKRLQKQKMERIRGVILDSPIPVTAHQWQATGESSREAFMADQGKSWPSAASSELRFPQCFQTWSSPNVVVSVTGADAHINICAVTKPGLIAAIVYALEKHNLEVLSAHVSCDYFRSMFMIHAQANGAPDTFPEALPLEEIFKSAVEEIIPWIS